MEQLGPYVIIIAASLVIILSFLFSELSKRTNIPSVLMLIILGVLIKVGLDTAGLGNLKFDQPLELLGIVGLIMIVLEAALELKLDRDKLLPIGKAFTIAAVGLMASTYIAAEVLMYFVPDMNPTSAWLYATPLSILSSAIIIPSVGGLRSDKKEFHIYESTFSDILGIIVFYYLAGPFDHAKQAVKEHIGETGEIVSHATEHVATEGGQSLLQYTFIIFITILIALIASYILVVIFQKLKSHVKLFLLIAVLLLLYSVGKKFHLSSLIIILVFGLMFANIKLFFFGPLQRFVQPKKIHEIFEGLHVVTLETAFVVRTFFFVLFGLSIDPSSLLSGEVALISGLIILSIYVIRYILLYIFVGKDLFPQVFVAPRGLITVLLYNAIPAAALIPGFQPGILLFVIIGTSVIMTLAMIKDKNRAGTAIRTAESTSVDLNIWQAPRLEKASETDHSSGH